MEFPKVNFANEKACFKALFRLIHLGDLRCPRCLQREGLQRHENHEQDWRVRYHCSHCGTIFSPWTGTPLQGTHHSPSEVLWVMHGMVQGKSKRQLAGELGWQWRTVAKLWRKILRLVVSHFGPPPEKSIAAGKGEMK